jgi:hypothetical protein|eukprot:SAG25_NODE_4707_length_764_cov_2.491729_1_plen_46_part_00
MGPMQVSELMKQYNDGQAPGTPEIDFVMKMADVRHHLSRHDPVPC